MIIKLFFSLFAGVFFIWSLTLFNSYSYLNSGKEAMENEEVLKAIVLFERAGLWYAPGFSIQKQSVGFLKKLSDQNSGIAPELQKRAESAFHRVQNQVFPWNHETEIVEELNKESILNIRARVFCHFRLAGWILFSLLFFFKGFQCNGTIRPLPACLHLVCSLLFFLSWVSALVEI